MSESKVVLVTGATGNQGGALARLLLERGHRVRALTRDPRGSRADGLRVLGAEVVGGDYEDPSSLRAAMAAVDAAFVVATPFEAGTDGEVRHGLALVSAASAAGVPHVVYSSVASADRGTGVPHFESKRRVELALEASGVPFTIVAPTEFIDMLVAPWSLPGLREGWIGAPVPGSLPRQLTAVADVAALAALVIERRDALPGRRIEIASFIATGDEIAAALSARLGRSVRFVELPMERAGSEDLAIMYRFYRMGGFSVGVSRLQRAFPEVAWHDLAGWVAARDWEAVLGDRAA